MTLVNHAPAASHMTVSKALSPFKYHVEPYGGSKDIWGQRSKVGSDDGGHDVIAIFNLPCKSMQIGFRLQILKLTCKTSVK